MVVLAPGGQVARGHLQTARAQDSVDGAVAFLAAQHGGLQFEDFLWRKSKPSATLY